MLCVKHNLTCERAKKYGALYSPFPLNLPPPLSPSPFPLLPKNPQKLEAKPVKGLNNTCRVAGCLSLRQNWDPPAPSRKRVCRPPWGGGNTRLRVRRREEPIRTTGETAWHSVYSVPNPLCNTWFQHIMVVFRFTFYKETKINL